MRGSISENVGNMGLEQAIVTVLHHCIHMWRIGRALDCSSDVPVLVFIVIHVFELLCLPIPRACRVASLVP